MQTELSLSTVTATQEQVDALLRELLPAQGQWSEAAYLWLTDHTGRLIEFTDGYLEVLPMPTDEHQTMVLLLYELLVAPSTAAWRQSAGGTTTAQDTEW